MPRAWLSGPRRKSQRKVLAPNDFSGTAEVARTLTQFERHYNQIAKPFEWVGNWSGSGSKRRISLSVCQVMHGYDRHCHNSL